MKRLAYNKRHNLGQLCEELLAAIPALRPVDAGAPNGLPDAVMTLEESPGSAWLWVNVPDDTNEATLVAVEAVVLAHDPTPAEQRQEAKKQVRKEVLAAAQSAVGVRFDQLQANQLRALMGLVLLREGALGTDGKVRPLDEWFRS